MAKISKKEKTESADYLPLSKTKLKFPDEESEFAESIINTVRDPFLVLNKELRVVKASRSFYDFFKVTSDETVGKSIYELGNHQWNIPKLRELLETILPEKITLDNYEVEHDFPSIGKRLMLLNSRQIKRASGKEKIILLAFEDITERRFTEKSFHETSRVTSEYLDNLYSNGNAPIVVWDSSMVITLFNNAFKKLSGYNWTEIRDKKIDVLFPKDKIDATLELIKNNLSNEKFETIEIDILTKDNDIRTVLWNSANIFDKEGENVIATIAQGQDITMRKQAEKHILKLNRIYAFLSSINKLIVRIHEPGRLLEETCRIAIDKGKFRMAWVGMVDPQNSKINVIVSAGYIGDYLEKFNNDLNDEQRSLRPSGRAIKSGEHYISNDIEHDHNMLLWQKDALKHGYRSSASFPLKTFDKVVGIFNLYSNEVDSFDESEIKLLDELAMDISFALEFIEREEQRKRTEAELIIVNKELVFQNEEKEKRADELIIADKELVFQNEEKGKRADELIIANKELVYQNEEKEKRAAELIIANKELVYQNEEKEKRAAELIIANKELVYQNKEKEKRAAELIIADKELVYQNEEKEKRADELIIADKELVYQNEEKEKRADELIIADKELVYQNEEKEKRADELIIADKELVYQNEEKGKRADELIIANKELVYQNEEKEKRAAELIIANKELVYQNEEKEKRAAELIIANKELVYQNEEKEKRAAELIIANKELVFQNEEKEKRAVELIIAKEKAEQSDKLKSEFLNQMSHEIRSPMNAVLNFTNLLKEEILEQLTPDLLGYFDGIDSAGHRLIRTVDLILNVSEMQIGTYEPSFSKFDLLKEIIGKIKNENMRTIEDKGLKLNLFSFLPEVMIFGDHYSIYQIFVNLIDNSIKYTKKGYISINVSKHEKGINVVIEDTGIGISEEFIKIMYRPFMQEERGSSRRYDGNGLGLSLVKKYCDLNGIAITVKSEKGIGTKFTLIFKADND